MDENWNRVNDFRLMLLLWGQSYKHLQACKTLNTKFYSSSGCGGSVMVSILAFYSDDLSSNPAGNSIFSSLYLEKMRINEKEAGDGF